MTVEDIAGYKPVWREALKGEWRGMEVHTFLPPSSGGPVLLRMLHGVGRGADLTRAGWHSAAEVHVLVELMKRAYADRNLMLGDPDFVQVELERFTDPAAGRKDRKAVKRRATQAKRILNPKALVRESGGHTTHFSVVDAKGNAVSQTQTINLAFGSGLLAPGTGVLLNNEIDDFATAPGKPNAFDLVQGEANAVAPGKRPLSSMTPTILTKDGAVDAVVGSPGGSHIITAVFQVLLNHYLHGMDASEAVCAPRVHHQWLPDVIFADHFALSADTRAKLSSMRHKVEERRLMGNVQAIFKGSAGWTGGADCRGEGLAAGL